MLNSTQIQGRLTADPELRQTPNGVNVTQFSLAVQRDYAPKGGERKTDFFDIIAWRQLAENVCKYLKKGSQIIVEGSLQSREYTDKNGTNHRVWEVMADKIHFVEKKAASPSATPTVPDTAPIFEEICDDNDNLPL